MSRELLFGIAGAVLVLITLIIAVKAIFDGKFKPHRITYGIFFLINIVVLTNQIINEGGHSVYFIAVGFFGISLIFGLSFKYGMGGSSVLDRVALISALSLGIYWIATQDSIFSTVIAIVIDLIALIPTIYKAYRHPDTEIYLNWMISGVGAFLGVFAIEDPEWVLFAFPIYIFFGNFFVVLSKYLGHQKLRRNLTSTS